MPRYRIAVPFAVCAAFVLCPFASLPAAESNDKTAFSEDHLVMQKALSQGEYYLIIKGEPAKAVQVLEAELPRINGNRRYLMLLRDAYLAHIRNLRLSHKTSLAETYLRRLRILDPNAADNLSPPSNPALTRRGQTPRQPARLAAPVMAKPATVGAPHTPSAAPRPKFRANLTEKTIDPFSRKHALDQKQISFRKKQAQQLLADANTEFQRKRYTEARQLYQQAYHANPAVLAMCKEKWAYCQLHFVVQELNRGSASPYSLAQLEQQVHSAKTMSPGLQGTVGMLLKQIAERKRGGNGKRQAQTVPIQHHTGRTGGWSIAETKYFRVLHKRDRVQAEQVARIAEQTRAKMFAKWFGSKIQAWRRKCDIYLHETALAYSRATGVSRLSPGHSRIETDQTNGAIVNLRIDLHWENKELLTAVLPHETTHVVLAGQFGKHHVPRWVDEGIAVLSEPARKLAVHNRNVTRALDDCDLFKLDELMKLDDYPRRNIRTFYSQSVSLVDFLSRQRSPHVFTQFVRDGLQTGYAAALRRYYGYASFAELQTRWTRFAQAEVTVASRKAQR